MQVLQAANIGITSLQKLVDSAKSVANQALQTTVGFSTKSSFTSVVIDGATADNLVADQEPISAAFVGTSAPQRAAYTSTAAAAGTQLETAGPVNATASTLLSALTVPVAAADTLIVNGKTITFEAGANGLVGSGNAYTMGINTSLTDLMTAIDTLSGNTPATASTATGGIITLRSGTASDLLVTGTALAKLEINGGGANTATRGGGALTAGALAGATKLSAGDGTAPSLSNGFAVGDTVTVNGRTLTFVAANSISNDPNEIRVNSDVTGLLAKIDGLTGSSTPSTIAAGQITLNTGSLSDLTLSSSNAAALTALGLPGGVTLARTQVPGVLEGKTLKIDATGGGVATDIVFGVAPGRVSSLNQLNEALAANNLQATFVSGKLTITTTNEAASATIGAITGSAVGASQAFAAGTTAPAPVVDASAKLTRDNLVIQYNNIINQITTTSQDASFNGVNLLGGDTLKLTFNETGKSTLNIQGVNFNPAGPRPRHPEHGRLQGQRCDQRHRDGAERRVVHAALAGFSLRFEPVDRADPSGLLEEPDQRAADRLVEPDAGRHQRGSGEQPGAVDPPVDRGVRAGAGQPVAAERAAAAPLSGTATSTIKTAGETPPFFLHER